jgi:hypothetical protein
MWGPRQADQSALTVNGTPHVVLGVQFGFEASEPPGLELPVTDGYVDVDRCGAVRHFPRLFAAGELTDCWHPCVTTSYAHGVQVAKSIQQDATRRRAPGAAAGELRVGSH